MDSIFLLTLLFIFLTALVSAYIARGKRDRCLKDMVGYQVTVELKNGKIIWGQLAVFSNGLEILYKIPHRDVRGHVETSAILFESQLTDIQAIYRYHDELSEANQEKRQLEILRTYHPGLHRQLRRVLRSFLNTFRDALNESIGFVISSVKDKSTLIKTQDKRLTQIGQTMVSASTPNAFEPILERYIGRRVVAEEVHDDAKKTIEYPGILKEYTGTWVELLDCNLTQEHTFDLSEPERLQLNRDLDFIIQKKANPLMLNITIENHGDETLHILRFEAENYIQAVETFLPPHETVNIDLSDLPSAVLDQIELEIFPDEVALRAEQRIALGAMLPAEIPALPSLRLVIEAAREGDICLPRQHAFIRHGAEAPNEDWLKESWRGFLPWIKKYRWRTFWRCLWMLFNTIVASMVGWGLIAGLKFDGIFLQLSFGLGVGLLYGGAWLIQWSMVIHGEKQHARRLQQRLGFVTLLMILVIVSFIWFLIWRLGW